MEIKKISKEEKEEGLTLELVNSVDMTKKASPVMFKKGDEPVKLVKCTTGYWVMYADNQYLKDKENKLMVFNERECQIARARYLFYFSEIEKAEEVEKLMQSRKRKVDDKLKIIEKNLDSMRQRAKGDSLYNAIRSVLDKTQQAKYDAEIKGYAEKLPEYERYYAELKELYDKGKIITLLDMLGIEKMSNPIFTAKYDNENDMRILKNVFGKESIDSSNGDMNVLLARLAIEKNY